MKLLTELDYINAANLLKCEVAVIKAVVEVESGGRGFLRNGDPKILFEGHWFYRLTKGKYKISNINYPKWITKFYNQDQHKRLSDAIKLDREAALMSASWGLFQIMGFNYKKCGFVTLQSFINSMYESEGSQLIAFCNYIKNVGLDDELRLKQWSRFAFSYNGPGFSKNKYEIKLERAYNKYK